MWITGLIICFGWIFSLCLHEFAHALIAYYGGDKTVKDKGYLTFNIFKYTQLGLSIILPLVFVILGGMALPGGAVYINHSLLKNRVWDSFVSAAGILANGLFALVLILPFWIFDYHEIDSVTLAENHNHNLIFASLGYLVYIEIFAVFFNLLPIPALDGYGIIKPWLPKKLNDRLTKYSKHSYFFIFGLFLFVPKFGLLFFGIIRNICDFLGVSNSVIEEGRYLFNQPINQLIAIIIILVLGYSLKFSEHSWYERGNQLATQKKDLKAIAAYDKAIAIKPDYVDAWHRKGDAYYRLKNYPSSIESYQKTVELNPQEYDAWIFLAHAQFHLKSYQSAAIAYKKAFELKPNTILSLKYLAESFYQEHNYLAAIEVYQQITEIQSENSTAWYNMACCYALQKNTEKAIAALQKAIAIEPKNTIELIKKDRDFKYLEDEKEFQKLIDI